MPAPRRGDERQSSRQGLSLPHLPESVQAPLREHATAMVDAGELLEFCNRCLAEFEKQQEHTSAAVAAKVDALSARTAGMESQLELKDQTISLLNQKIEDMEMLLKMIDRAQKGAA